MAKQQSPASLSRRSFLGTAAAVAVAGSTLPQAAWAAQLASDGLLNGELIVRQADPLNDEPALAEIVQAAQRQL